MGKTNLFQIACADVRERFHYGIWLFIVVCRNMTDTGWNLDDLWPMLVDVFCIFLAEVAVDWIKHSFITKFNVIPSDVYKEYTVSIAYDLLLCRQGKNTSDYFDLLSRRMGLTPIPLSCLINVMIFQTVRNPGYVWCCLPVFLFMLFATKIVTNMALLSFAYAYVKAYIKAMSTAQAEVSSMQQQTHVDTTSKIVDVDNIRFVDAEPHPAKRRVLPEHQAHTRLIPVRYTGYDQPTGDEEQFLPMVLRHRHVRSESGCESGPTSVVKDMLGVSAAQVGLPIDGDALGSNRSAATNSKCILTHSTPYATPSREMGGRIEDDVWMVAQSEPNDYFWSPLVLSGDSPMRPVSRSASSLSNLSRSRLNSEHLSSNSVVSTAENKPAMEPAEFFTLVSASSFFLSAEETKPDYTPAAVVEPNPLVMPGEHSPKNRSLFSSTRPRCYSIDLGVLSGFSRLANLCPTPIYPEVTVMVESKFPGTRPIAESCVPQVDQQSQTEPLFPRRRKRTRTEGSERDVPRTVLDERLPIMWERSNRNSVVQQFETARMMIRQPLSDVDRYSMIEGQIS
ncbi:uncharacterized protein DEA37_0008886 [Paragonimus westermani]|uniref:Protein TAPT1 n=1 Tax=Paragonimus westermani TaxID=34504 RepID=A0A5J4NAB3_9TREM|nr:uncharacterized protein DEA37_0008886 [Paragonimus westermani]